MALRLFPLYLAPLEAYLLADDGPRYPMTFTIQADLAGRIDRQAFERALCEALQRHPLLRAVVGRAKSGRYCWLEAPNAMLPVDWADAAVPVGLASGDHIDLFSEPGLRLWVRQGDDSVRITSQFHHSCCDGIGAYRFLGDVLAIYGRLTTSVGSRKPELESLEPGRLRQRAAKTLSSQLMSRSLLANGWKTTKYFWQFRWHPAQPLAAWRAEQARPLRGFPAITSFTFSRAETRELQAAAADAGVTFNDMIIADFFLAIASWNVHRERRQSNRCIRVMMPVDMRDAEDYALPAADLAAYTFLARSPGSLLNEKQLLADTRNDTARIKHYRLGTEFGDAAYALQRVPWVARAVFRLNICSATAVLSNVGDPARRFTAKFPRHQGSVVCGNLQLERITGAPPIRRNTRAAVSIFSYKRELTISVRTDPYLFTAAENDRFLSHYLNQLCQRLAVPRGVSVPAIDDVAA